MAWTCPACQRQSPDEQTQCFWCQRPREDEARRATQQGLRFLLRELHHNPVFDQPKNIIAQYYEKWLNSLQTPAAPTPAAAPVPENRPSESRITNTPAATPAVAPEPMAETTHAIPVTPESSQPAEAVAMATPELPATPGNQSTSSPSAKRKSPIAKPAPREWTPAQAAANAQTADAAATPDGRGFFMEGGIRALLYLGVMLFALGLAVFVHNQWHAMHNMAKFLLLGAVSGAMLGAGRFCRTRLQLPNAALAFTALGAFSIPIDIYAGVHMRIFPWDGYAVGMLTGALGALGYAALARITMREIFMYGAIASGSAAVWMTLMLMGRAPLQAAEPLVLIPILLTFIEWFGCDAARLPDAALRQLYGRPLRYGALVLMAALMITTVMPQLHSRHGAESPLDRLLLSSSVIAFTALWAVRLRSPWMLLVAVFFEILWLRDMGLWLDLSAQGMAWLVGFTGLAHHAGALACDARDAAPAFRRWLHALGGIIGVINIGRVLDAGVYGPNFNLHYAFLSGYCLLPMAATLSYMWRRSGSVASTMLTLLVLGEGALLLGWAGVSENGMFAGITALMIGYTGLTWLNLPEHRRRLAQAALAVSSFHVGILIINMMWQNFQLIQGEADMAQAVTVAVCGIAMAGSRIITSWKTGDSVYGILGAATLWISSWTLLAHAGLEPAWASAVMMLTAGAPLLLRRRTTPWMQAAWAPLFILCQILPLLLLAIISGYGKSIMDSYAVCFAIAASWNLLLGRIANRELAGVAFAFLAGAAYLCFLRFISTGVPHDEVFAAYVAFTLAIYAASALPAWRFLRLGGAMFSLIAAALLWSAFHHRAGYYFDGICAERTRWMDALLAGLFAIATLAHPRGTGAMEGLRAAWLGAAAIFGLAALRGATGDLPDGQAMHALLLLPAALAAGAWLWQRRGEATLSRTAAIAAIAAQCLLLAWFRDTRQLCSLLAVYSALACWTGALTLPSSAGESAATTTGIGMLFAAFGWHGLLDSWALSPNAMALALQAGMLPLAGMAAWWHARRQELPLRAACTAGFVMQILWSCRLYLADEQAAGICLLFAGATAVLSAPWQSSESRGAWRGAALVSSTLGYVYVCLGYTHRSDAAFVQIVATLGAVHGALALLLPARWQWHGALRNAVIADAILVSAMAPRYGAQIHAAQGAWLAAAFLTIAASFAMIYVRERSRAFLTTAAVYLGLGYITALWHREIDYIEAYTLLPALLFFGLAWQARREPDGERARTLSQLGALTCLLPAFFAALPATERANMHALLAILSGIAVLLAAMGMRIRRPFMTGIGGVVLLSVIKAAQFLQVGDLSKGQWGMILGALLIGLGAALEAYRRKRFENALAAGKQLAAEWFEDWV